MDVSLHHAMGLFWPFLPSSVRAAVASDAEVERAFASAGREPGGGGNGGGILWARENIPVLVEVEEADAEAGEKKEEERKGGRGSGNGGRENGSLHRPRRLKRVVAATVGLRLAVTRKYNKQLAARLTTGWEELLEAAGALEQPGSFVLLERYECDSDDGDGGGGGKKAGGKSSSSSPSSESKARLVAVKCGQVALPSREAAIAAWKKETGWAERGGGGGGKRGSGGVGRGGGSSGDRSESGPDSDGPILPSRGRGIATVAFRGGPKAAAGGGAEGDEEEEEEDE